MTHLLDHPLIQDRLARLRSADCPPERFRQLVGQIARLMVPGVTADLAVEPVQVNTPLERMEGRQLARPIVLVPILRAGLGMAEGFLALLPEAQVAHIGLSRDEETLLPDIYYFSGAPRIAEAEVIVLDPMLATGGSAVAALQLLRERGARHLRFVCLVACPEGCARLAEALPELPVYAAAMDRELNERGYILPGLGDAGDRIFGTL